MSLDSISSYDSSAARMAALTQVDGPAAPLPVVQKEKGYPSQDTIESIADESVSKREIATRSLKQLGFVAGSGLALSAALYGVGAAASLAGESILVSVSGASASIAQVGQLVSLGLVRLGSFAQTTGRALFLTITVPPYLLLYQFPRWILTEQLPKLAQIVVQNLLKMGELLLQITHKIVEGAILMAKASRELLFKALENLRLFFQPVSHLLKSAWKGILNLSYRFFELLQKTASYLHYAFFRAVDFIAVVATEAMRSFQVALRFIAATAQQFALSLKPLGKMILTAFDYGWNQSIVLAKKIVDFFKPALTQIFLITKRLATEVARVATDVGTAVLRIMTESLRITGDVFKLLWSGIKKSASASATLVFYLANQAVKVIQTAALGFVAWVTPAFQFLGNRFQAIGSSVVRLGRQCLEVTKRMAQLIVSSAKFVADLAFSAGKWVYRLLLPPVARGAEWMGVKIATLFNLTFSAGEWVYVRIAPPLNQMMFQLGQLIYQSAELVFNGVVWASEQIVSSFFIVVEAVATAAGHMGAFFSKTGRSMRTALANGASSLMGSIRSFFGKITSLSWGS